MVNEPLIQPIEDLVRERAYQLYVRRAEQGQPDSEFDDWIKAEREIVSAAIKADRNLDQSSERW
jgi:hypothetical protein